MVPSLLPFLFPPLSLFKVVHSSQPTSSTIDRYEAMAKKILVLHGNRQTGALLLGRIEKLKKATARELGWEMIAPDAPHLYSTDDDDLRDNDINDEDAKWQRAWWHRKGNMYAGLETSISMLLDIWSKGDFVGILGFSQGSRLAHIIAIMNNVTNGAVFAGLEFVVHASGYGDVHLPENLSTHLADICGNEVPQTNLEIIRIIIPSLHIMGDQDKLIPLKSSLALMETYQDPVRHTHPGGHHVPVKAVDVPMYLQFFHDANEQSKPFNDATEHIEPDEEHLQTQIDEVAALSQIFPTEFKLLSESALLDNADPDDYSEESRTFQHPIRYSILLQPQDDFEQDANLWPPKQISLGIQYPPDYPDSPPQISLVHDMNYLEFSMQQSDALTNVILNAIEEESGMPCVMSVIYAARDFFENGGLSAAAVATAAATPIKEKDGSKSETNIDEESETIHQLGSLPPCSAKRKKDCIEQGLEIAYAMLSSKHSDDLGDVNSSNENGTSVGKGGSWKYTIGLVGKPSAGKSTFFNAATAFARQRGAGGGAGSRDGNGENDMIVDGAAMAAHPFTTIDPNIGYCLVPAPTGSCPEDDKAGRDKLIANGLVLGSTHGRDSKGRRLISLCLKDVAGLVPGAYQGRGKGNKVRWCAF